MNPIYFFYFYFRRLHTSKGILYSEYPLIFIVVLLQPAHDSLLRLLFSIPQQHEVFRGRNFYGRVDRWFYLAFALSALTTYLFVEKRTNKIEAKFDSIDLTRLLRMRWPIMGVVTGLVLFFQYIEYYQYHATLPVYLLVGVVLSRALVVLIKP